MERIDSRENPKIKALCRLLRGRGARREAGLFVCEGALMLRRRGGDLATVPWLRRVLSYSWKSILRKNIDN